MRRWGVPIAVAVAAVAMGARPTLGRGWSGSGAGPRVFRPERPARLDLYYTPPVLVKAGEAVRVPVDVVCATARGRACQAEVSLGVWSGGGPWEVAGAARAGGVTFDLTRPATRAALGSPGEAVSFFLTARHPSGVAASLPAGGAAAPLQFFVAREMRPVAIPAIPFGRVRAGRTVLALPWGTGPARAGIDLGSERATTGPSAFDVDAQGRLYLLDPIQGRLGVFKDGAPVGGASLEVGPDATVAVTASGAAFVLDSAGASARVRRVAPDGTVGSPVDLGPAIPSEVRVLGERAFARLLPLDAWVPVPAGPTSGAAMAPSVGLPTGPDSQVVRVGGPRSVRVGTVRGDRVEGALQLSSTVDLGDVALAESDGRGGYVVVVRTWREVPPADQYQVVHVSADGSILDTFAVASEQFADSAPTGKFRLGPDGRLYQLTSSPSGIRIVQFDLRGDGR